MSMQLATLGLFLPFILVAEGFAVSYVWSRLNSPSAADPQQGDAKVLGFLYRNPIGMAILVGIWLLLTVTTIGYEFFIALVASYLLLFSLGRFVTVVGMALFAVLFISTPFVWGRLIVGLGPRYRRPRLATAGQAQLQRV